MKKIKLSKKKKVIISIIAIILILAILGTGILFLKGASAEYVLTNKDTITENSAKGYKEALTDNFGNTLLYNPENAFVAIKNSASKRTLLPCSKTAKRDGNSSVLNLTVRDSRGNSYIMNSTDNSVSFKTFAINEEKNALEIIFTLFKDEASAKQGFKLTGFSVEIPVTFTTENGNLKVSVNCENIKLSTGLYIEKLSILPGLFSLSDALKGEHFIIPDGSGALVDLSSETPEDIKLSLDVFGSDVAVKDSSFSALLPCYALANDKYIDSVIISDGEALATINCNRFKKVGSGNLYSEFTLTPVSVSSKGIATKLCNQYEGEVSLTLVSSEIKTNSYNTLAVVARDYFTKKGYLSDKVNYDFGDLPFFVNVIGSPKDSSTPLTTFEDASEMVALLNSKGVRNVALRFMGALDGGLKGASVSNSPVLNSLGGVEDLTALCSLANEKRSSVFVDVNLFSGGTPIRNINGTVKASLYPEVYSFMTKENVKTSLSDSSSLGKNISSVYKLLAGIENLNVSLNDASFLLFTDGNLNKNRQEMLEETKEMVSSFSLNSALMLSKPSLWLMNTASAVSSVPQKCSRDGGYAVKSVPLLQMVIHGSVIYGGEPINATNSGWESVLKSIEVGAVPSYLFTYEDCANLSYGAYASQAAQYYSKIKSLKAIQNMPMTSHEMLLGGVYKITYGYSKTVYVNYNKSIITVDGLLLSPQDFILV